MSISECVNANWKIHGCETENEKLKSSLALIRAIGFDRDGCNDQKSLGELVDELTHIAGITLQLIKK